MAISNDGLMDKKQIGVKSAFSSVEKARKEKRKRDLEAQAERIKKKKAIGKKKRAARGY